MVIIISRPNDQSTANVIDWLHYLKKPFRRINGSDIFSPRSQLTLHLNADEFNFSIDGDQVDNPCNVDAVWFRRNDTYQLPKALIDELAGEGYHEEIITHINNENAMGKQAFYCCLANGKKLLGHYDGNHVNKLRILAIAKRHHLSIPDTMITNSKSDLRRMLKKHGIVITKPIGNSFTIPDGKNEQQKFQLYTEELTVDSLEAIPETFSHSLFQQKLDKVLDIRTFYLNGCFYSMAIFSQANSQTKLDFKKYANNRNIPYKLPASIEDSLHRLMTEAGLNTGSIDLIKAGDGRIVFLEVNPVGQYDMTTVPCNYHLDRKIAEFLAN